MKEEGRKKTLPNKFKEKEVKNMKNKKIITTIIILYILIPIFYFPNVMGEEPEDNFYAISESDKTTEWKLQGKETTPFEDFHDNINTNYWNLEDVDETYFEKSEPHQQDYLLDNCSIIYDTWNYTDVSYPIRREYNDLSIDIFWDGINWWILEYNYAMVFQYYLNWNYTGIFYYVGEQDSSPRGIFWDGTNWWMIGAQSKGVYQYYLNWTFTGISYYIGNQDSYPWDIEFDGTNWWMIGSYHDRVYKYDLDWNYMGTSFKILGLNSIIWDGLYFYILQGTFRNIYQYYSNWTYTGVLINIDNTFIGFFWDGVNWWLIDGYVGRVYKYIVYDGFCNIFKNYFGNGYMYMQTNTTELISLKSIDYGTYYILNSGDYFEVDFQTNSNSEIKLSLLKDDVIQKTLILSQSGNINFTNQTIQIHMDEDIEFDQLRISGILEDTDYIKIYDIKTYKYEITGDYVEFLVGPENTHSVYLTPDTYNLKIFEEELEVINENITIGYDDYFYVYTPIKRESNPKLIGIDLIPLIAIISLATIIPLIIIIKRKKQS